MWNARMTKLVVLLSISIPGQGHAQATQEQRYFDWTELDFPAEEYQTRRARLLGELTKLGVDVLLLSGAEGTSDGETFRQNDDLFYLSGLEVPRSVLALDASGRTAILFAPAQDHRFSSATRANDFPGRPLADDPELSARTGLDVRDIEGFETYVAELRDRSAAVGVLADPETRPDTRALFSAPPGAGERMGAHLAASQRGLRLVDARAAIARVRSVKSEAEVARLRAAARLTAQAIREAATHVADGVDERTLEGWFEAACKRGGSARVPFAPIIKSGPNSLWPWRILAAHYKRRNRAMSDGELVIFDVGCEVDQYVSDVGRTLPVSGRFTPEQRRILEMETAVADAIIAAIRPGVTFADLRSVAYQAIPEDAEAFMQVGLFFGHHLGLSTGDPFEDDQPLEAGMVFTVEPWYYNHASALSVFTEDVVLVTETGADVLSSDLPRDPEGLERLIR